VFAPSGLAPAVLGKVHARASRRFRAVDPYLYRPTPNDPSVGLAAAGNEGTACLWSQNPLRCDALECLRQRSSLLSQLDWLRYEHKHRLRSLSSLSHQVSLHTALRTQATNPKVLIVLTLIYIWHNSQTWSVNSKVCSLAKAFHYGMQWIMRRWDLYAILSNINCNSRQTYIFSL